MRLISFCTSAGASDSFIHGPDVRRVRVLLVSPSDGPSLARGFFVLVAAASASSASRASRSSSVSFSAGSLTAGLEFFVNGFDQRRRELGSRAEFLRVHSLAKFDRTT